MVDVPKSWLGPLLVAVSVAGGGGAITYSLAERVATLEAQHAEMARRMGGVDDMGERLARIETLLELAIERLGIMGRASDD